MQDASPFFASSPYRRAAPPCQTCGPGNDALGPMGRVVGSVERRPEERESALPAFDTRSMMARCTQRRRGPGEWVGDSERGSTRLPIHLCPSLAHTHTPKAVHVPTRAFYSVFPIPLFPTAVLTLASPEPGACDHLWKPVANETPQTTCSRAFVARLDVCCCVVSDDPGLCSSLCLAGEPRCLQARSAP